MHGQQNVKKNSIIVTDDKASGLRTLPCKAFGTNPPQGDNRCSLFPPTCLQHTENVKAPLNIEATQC